MANNKTSSDKPREVPNVNEFRGLTVRFADITQRQFEKLDAASAEISDMKVGNHQKNRLLIKAAVRSGWFDGQVVELKDGEDDPMLDWPPAQVTWLAKLITDKYAEVGYLDPS